MGFYDNDFAILEKECDIEMMKIIQDYHTSVFGYEFVSEGVKDVVDKVKETIQKVLDAIVEFAKNIKKKLVELFTEKDVEKKLDQIDEYSNRYGNKKVTVMSTDRMKKKLNEYINEYLKLEREIIKIRYNMKHEKTPGAAALAKAEYDKISKKIDELNAKFDKEFLDENQDTIELAVKDAVRFSKKQLQDVKVDFEALESGSKKILQQFKKDADGVESPVEANLFTKLANSVGTLYRKMEIKSGNYKKHTLLGILALASVGAVLNNPSTRDTIMKKVTKAASSKASKQNNRPVKDGLDDAVNTTFTEL